MKKFRSMFLLLIIAVLLAGLMVPAMAQEDAAISPAVTAGCSTLDAQKPLKSDEQLLKTAKAVILYELDSRTLVYAWNPDEELDPSGMNKIMTALLALEQGDPEAEVLVSSEALNSVESGSVSARLESEERMKLKDLLYCMMVGSANDAAAVIAEHISGSQSAFVELMNQRATELGCKNTRFMNPTGLSHEDQHTTARDLAKITEAALQIDMFVELFSAKKYTVPATNLSEERNILTTNHLMSKETIRYKFDERVTGGKTGALSTTDRSVIATAESGGMRYLTVVMSAKATFSEDGQSLVTFGNFEETRELLNHGFGQYITRQLLSKDQVVGQFPVSGGENDIAANPSEALTVILPGDMKESEVSYQCIGRSNGVSAPVKRGDVVGTAEVWFQSICIGHCDLVAMYDVNEPGIYNIPLTPNIKPASEFPWGTVLLISVIIVLSFIVLAGAALIAVRLLSKPRKKQRRRYHRKNRQRRR